MASDSKNDAKFVVTGGAGFIGSTLVRTLLERGKVVVIDNLLTGHEANLADVRGKIEFHNLDICDAAALEPVIRGADTVFHLAAIPSVPRSIEDPVPSHEININGTFNVLSAAVRGKVRRVVYAASSSAYGDSEILPKTETMTPLPKSPYAVQKLLGEHYAAVFQSCYGLETVSLRFFNVYGPRQDPTSAYSGVLSLFMKHLLARTSPTIFGDGEQSRDFTYVKNAVDANLLAAEAPAASGKVFNVANGKSISINEVLEILKRLTGRNEIKAEYAPPRGGDVRDSLADLEAATAVLGYQPKVGLEEGLQLTLEWWKTSRFSRND